MLIGDIMFGEMFMYQSALFVMCAYDWESKSYPSLCVVTKNANHDRGEKYSLNEGEPCKPISRAELKKLFLNDCEYVGIKED